MGVPFAKGLAVSVCQSDINRLWSRHGKKDLEMGGKNEAVSVTVFQM